MNKQTLVVAQLILSTFAVTLIPGSIDSVTAQTTTVTPSQSDEQTLRDLVRQENEGKKVIQFTEDYIFVSGALPRPVIGRAAHEKAKSDRMISVRSVKDEVVRLAISQSGDMAEEFGNFTMSYDEPNKPRTTFSGSYLRVWRKTDGEWRVDAFFARPNEPEEKRKQKSDS